MRRIGFGLVMLVVAVGLAVGAAAQSGAGKATDHITIYGPGCTAGPCADMAMKDAIRFLMGQWAREFEIAVVLATEEPKCMGPKNTEQCSAEVQPKELVLGSRPNTLTSKKNWGARYPIFYTVTRGSGFGVQRGDELVALASPAIHPGPEVESYVAARLDHATEELVEEVKTDVAELLIGAFGDK